MAERNDEVMEMVRRELEKDPEIGLGQLQEMAKEIDASVGELTPRQFHARYPLQVKRARGGGASKQRKGGRKRAAKESRAEGAPSARDSSPRPSSERDAIRGIFMQFAGDFAQAESRQEIVGVLSSVDAYVDRIQKLTGK